MKVWINVTTSYKWNGPFVGIVRTEVSITRYLLKFFKDRAQLVTICPDGKFFIIDKKTYLDKFDSAQNDRDGDPAVQKTKAATITTGIRKPLSPMFPVLGKKAALKALCQSFYSLSPGCVRPIINKIFYKLKPTFLNTYKHLKNRKCLTSRAPIAPKNHEKILHQDSIECPFSKDDIFFTCGLDWELPNFFENLFFLKKKHGFKVASFCYDLIPILYPQYCLPRVAKIFKKYFLDLSETSDIVFCDSKCSQQDFINFIKSLGGKVASSSVIRLGCEIPTNQDSSIPQLMEQEFILFVSTIERRKNHDVLYKAYHNLLKKHNKNKIPKLVFVGRKAWGVSELLSDINLDPVTKDQILILSNISDEQLSWLYKKALFVCYPSFYEGWGLPISEALLHGKFVLASNTSSIPEIAGNLVEYVDPYSATEWESKLEYYFGNRQELVRREKLIQSEFEGDSWESCAQTIIIELQEMNSSLR